MSSSEPVRREWVDTDSLKTGEPFASLFPTSPETRDSIKASIQKKGFDPQKPLTVWRDAYGVEGDRLLVDGYTRLDISIELGLPQVFVAFTSFEDEVNAVEAAIEEQMARRNLSRAEAVAAMLRHLPLVDVNGRSAEQVAVKFGVSKKSITRARYLFKHDRRDLIEDVIKGRRSLRAAYEEAAVDAGDFEVEIPERGGRRTQSNGSTDSDQGGSRTHLDPIDSTPEAKEEEPMPERSPTPDPPEIEPLTDESAQEMADALIASLNKAKFNVDAIYGELLNLAVFLHREIHYGEEWAARRCGVLLADLRAALKDETPVS